MARCDGFAQQMTAQEAARTGDKDTHELSHQ
jgi:hypothetical protein